MNVWSIACSFGLPALLLGYVIAKFKTVRTETEAIKKGVQALLRAEMIHEFNKWTAKGQVPIYARENMANLYKNYHDLGKNGVMTDLYNKFLELPIAENNKQQ